MKGGIWQQKASENTYGERGKKTDWPKEMRHWPEAGCRSSACFRFRHSHLLGLTGRCLISEWWETLWELSCFFWQAPIFTNVPFAQGGICLQLTFTEWNAKQGIIKGPPSRGKSLGWANLLGHCWGRKSEFSCRSCLQPRFRAAGPAPSSGAECTSSWGRSTHQETNPAGAGGQEKREVSAGLLELNQLRKG